MARENMKNAVKSEWDEKVVSLRRAAKVTTGGKRFRFNAIVIVGNGKGMVGLGYGKANELADAIRKAKDKAIRAAKKIQMKNTTIPHELQGKYKSGVIFMKPASKGTGVIAGGAVRPERQERPHLRRPARPSPWKAPALGRPRPW